MEGEEDQVPLVRATTPDAAEALFTLADMASNMPDDEPDLSADPGCALVVIFCPT